MALQRKKFEETIDFLLEELILAMKWDRPSILLAVHKSKPSQKKAENALKAKLNKAGSNVVALRITDDSPDAAQLILTSKADLEKDIFFISNIDQGGGEDGRNAYRALNLYRETFVENKIKVVFWLDINEEIKLPKYAPDFWAFRHRVVEFSSTHQSKKPAPPVGLLLWGMQNHIGAMDTLNEMVASRKQLLGELPDSPEALSMRIELLNNLGYLYWTLGDDMQASVTLTSAAQLARHEDFHTIRIQILNGLAILAYERENYQEAFNIYTELVNKNPKNALLRVNLAVVLSALGKNYLAISQVGKAIKLDTENFEILYIAGYLNFTLGKFDIAVGFLGKSIKLAPSMGSLYEMMGICYKEMELFNDAKSQLGVAVNLGGNRIVYSKICEEALFGNTADAVVKLKDYVTSGKMSRQSVARDPNLNAAFGNELLREIIDRPT